MRSVAIAWMLRGATARVTAAGVAAAGVGRRDVDAGVVAWFDRSSGRILEERTQSLLHPGQPGLQVPVERTGPGLADCGGVTGPRS